MILNGDCIEILRDKIPDNSIDCIITDPPYNLGFMGKDWDKTGIAENPDTWKEFLRVLKPGGYCLAFGGSRTFHRMAFAMEIGGFEIRDTVMWLYGSGMPKSMNIGLAIDKRNGVENKTGKVAKGVGTNNTLSMNSGVQEHSQFKSEYEEREAQNEWRGWGSCLKPAYEPIIVARKPFKGSLVDNVLEYSVGGLNIDECRVGNETISTHMGRFPANVILTYSEEDKEEVCGGFPQSKGSSGKGFKKEDYAEKGVATNFKRGDFKPYNDDGSAARYFYCAKASKRDRDEGLDEFSEQKVYGGDQNWGYGNKNGDNFGERVAKVKRRNIHPTVKPTAVMQYLVRLVAPKGAKILDPFMGSGSTGKAVAYENKDRDMGYEFIGIEMKPEYCEIAKARIEYVSRSK